VVPFRGYAQGKSRLATVLDAGARARLNRRLLLSTLRAIARWQGDLHRCIVVSPCRRALLTARRMGATALLEAPRAGLNPAADRGASHARRRGARGVLILPSDLPDLDPASLAAMTQAARAFRHVVLAPDRKGNGTNALLVAAPGRFELQFGEGSFERHQAQAARRGYGVSVCRRPELAFDIDTPEDLAGWCNRRR
jgi:2-phospho-L-lactate guanylyltransferase